VNKPTVTSSHRFTDKHFAAPSTAFDVLECNRT